MIGIDTLGGFKYPEVIKQLHNKYATGYFWREFGSAEAVVEADAKQRRQVVRIQGLWQGSHNYTDADKKLSLNIANKLNKLAAKYPNTKFYYSPFCEHKRPATYMRQLLSEIKAKYPLLEPVNSPISGGQWVDGFINEIHHNDKPAGMPKGQYIFSMDGLHQPDCNIEIYKARHLNDANCILFLCWALQHNCKPNSKPENNKPPKSRTTKPTHDLNLSLIFQVENAKQKVSLPKGWLYKSHSEQHKDVDPRANKPVILTPKGKRFNSVTLGRYSLKESGSHDGRQVWRFSQWGYKSGRLLEIKANGKSVGTVDAGWRENEYREKT